MVFDTQRRHLMNEGQQAMDSFQACRGLGEALQLADGYLATLNPDSEAYQAVAELTQLIKETFDDHFEVVQEHSMKKMKKVVF